MVAYSTRGRNIQVLPEKRVGTSQRSSVSHVVSLYGLPISDHVMRGVLLSILIYYNEHIMRVGVTVR